MSVLRPDEVAIRWQCSDRFVHRLIQKGELPAIRLGGKLLRVPLEAVEAYEKCHLLNSASSSSEVGTTQHGEIAVLPADVHFGPKIMRLPSKGYEVLPCNTKSPTGQKL